jgi:hypothetical protein
MRLKPLCGLVLLASGLGGCKPALAPAAFSDGAPGLRPEVFFAGATNSTGVLEDRSGAPTARFHVAGTGLSLPDGSFGLDQRVSFDDDPTRTRRWVLQRLNAHDYGGTLTDASGPVTGEAYGNLFHLRYAMKTPFGGEMEQWLYLQPDGRTVMNEATVSVFGVVVARLSERITRETP